MAKGARQTKDLFPYALSLLAFALYYSSLEAKPPSLNKYPYF